VIAGGRMHHRPKEPSLMGSCRRLKEE